MASSYATEASDQFKISRKALLNPEACSFVPGNKQHVFGILSSNLDPRAAIFKPRAGTDVLAKPFQPVSHAGQLLGHTIASAAEIYTNHQIPMSGPSKIETESAQDLVQQNNGGKLDQATKIDAIPVPISRLMAEHGQLARKKPPMGHKPKPSRFPIEGDTKPSFIAAGTVEYDGRLEDQRQKFHLSQNASRVLQYNWRGKPLSATGDEMPDDDSDMTEEARRAEQAAQPPPIHHFNWLGQPVHFKSNTPPTVSLVVIMSLLDAKGLSFGPFPRDLYKATLFNNALATIDPVMYFGKDPENLADLRGTALQNAITGSVAKMYSRHGCWHDSHREHYAYDEEKPLWDDLDAEQYTNTQGIANGWYANFAIPTARDFVEFDAQVNMKNAIRKRVHVLERMGRIAKKSSLKRVIYLRGIDGQDEASGLSSCAESISNQPSFDNALGNWADETDSVSHLPAINEDWREYLQPLNHHLFDSFQYSTSYENSPAASIDSKPVDGMNDNISMLSLAPSSLDSKDSGGLLSKAHHGCIELHTIRTASAQTCGKSSFVVCG